jgi:hypothetical protein
MVACRQSRRSPKKLWSDSHIYNNLHVNELKFFYAFYVQLHVYNNLHVNERKFFYAFYVFLFFKQLFVAYTPPYTHRQLHIN